MRLRGSILLLALSATPALAQQAATPGGAAPITAAEIDGHLRFLSLDLLEGRAPGTRGGRLAAEYIASELRSYGVKPGNGDSYFQEVPIDLVTLQPQTLRVAASGKATAMLKQPEDVVVWAGSAAPETAAKGELVFVGYGAKAPEYRWDDFKGQDLKGKVLLILVNDPPAPAKEPDLFGGRAMTYYGRWTYKFEEAERQGAAGALVIHTTERAGYPWHTVVGSWGKEQRMLPRPADAPAPLPFRGWITDTAATALLKQAGLDLAKLTKQAESRSFKPVATGITIDVAMKSDVERLESRNVVGIVPGADAKLKDTYVVLSAHWDHLGIGPAVNGDSIYNGALDNASGVSDLLAIARAAAHAAPTPRSLLFAFVTAEESGLLGSQYFAEHPTVPLGSLVANVNVDGGNLTGRVKDLVVLGQNKSSLGPDLLKMISAEGMRLTPEEHPEAGYFYRSDHFSFAKQGVPAVSVGEGYEFEGKPAGWGKQQEEDYTAHRYHQPSDEYRADFDLSGAVQLSNVVLNFARELASSPALPTWAADAEFQRKATP